MNDTATEQDENGRVESIILTCILCGKAEDIYVFRERKLPGKMYWECFDCQKREARN